MKLQSIPSWLIILICSIGGLVLACVYSSPPVYEPTLTALPALPEPAAFIQHIETGGFFRDEPFVQTVDGQIYRLWEEEDAPFWEIKTLPSSPDMGSECSSQDYASIAKEASSIVECRAVQRQGEWCPGPIVSYAIDENGLVWKMTRYHDTVCPFLVGLSLVFFVPAGFVLGLVLVGFRRGVKAIKFRRRVESVG